MICRRITNDDLQGSLPKNRWMMQEEKGSLSVRWSILIFWIIIPSPNVGMKLIFVFCLLIRIRLDGRKSLVWLHIIVNHLGFHFSARLVLSSLFTQLVCSSMHLQLVDQSVCPSVCTWILYLSCDNKYLSLSVSRLSNRASRRSSARVDIVKYEKLTLPRSKVLSSEIEKRIERTPSLRHSHESGDMNEPVGQLSRVNWSRLANNVEHMFMPPSVRVIATCTHNWTPQG